MLQKLEKSTILLKVLSRVDFVLFSIFIIIIKFKQWSTANVNISKTVDDQELIYVRCVPLAWHDQ